MGAVRLFFNIILLSTVVVAVTTSFACNRTWLSSTREQNLRKSKTHRFYQGTASGHLRAGHAYRIRTARSYVTCAVVCLLDDACTSFHYCMDGKRCQLNSAVYSGNTTTLHKSSSCIYFNESFHKGIRFPVGDEQLSDSVAVTEIPTQTTMTQPPLIETYAPTLVTTTRVAVESSASLCPRMYNTQSGLKLTAEQHLPFVFDFTVSSGNKVTVKLSTNNNDYTVDVMASSIKIFGGGSSSSSNTQAMGKQIHVVFGISLINVSVDGANLYIGTSGLQGATCSITLISDEEATWIIDPCDVDFS